MIAQTSPALATARTSGFMGPPKNFPNCYEILNASALSRPVNIYQVEFSDPAEQTHENRGRAKQVDAWNEGDALYKLCAELKRRRWIGDEACWTVAEILKTAEHWRLLRSVNGQMRNPLAGYAVFPFEDPTVALVATTGAPYLTQGTALPLLVRVSNISGQARREEVVRDVVWQADMCFTKPDIGMRLPWVLNVADCGALQLSRSYRLSGITA